MQESSESTIKTQAKEIDKLRKRFSKITTEGGKGVSKRIVLHSDVDILRLVTALQNNLSKLKATKGSGSTYVRWGERIAQISTEPSLYTQDIREVLGLVTVEQLRSIFVSPPILSDAHDAGAQVYGAELNISLGN